MKNTIFYSRFTELFEAFRENKTIYHGFFYGKFLQIHFSQCDLFFEDGSARNHPGYPFRSFCASDASYSEYSDEDINNAFNLKDSYFLFLEKELQERFVEGFFTVIEPGWYFLIFKDRVSFEEYILDRKVRHLTVGHLRGPNGEKYKSVLSISLDIEKN